MNTKAEFLGVSMVENVLDRAWAVKVKVNTLEQTKSLDQVTFQAYNEDVAYRNKYCGRGWYDTSSDG
eukprot:m.438393 g.438393  ORF g.438393 m.438393 type:complete len:67 (+) comp18230_c0_seq1:2323-2523(+)